MTLDSISHIYRFQIDSITGLFDPNTLQLFLIPHEADDSSNAAGLPSFSGRSDAAFSKTTLDCDPCDESFAGDDYTKGLRPGLDRLTLVISNTCNLACAYCYAHGGSYYGPNGSLMTKETALNAINYAMHRYSSIHHISFFGGEPTLNPQIVKLVCEYVFYLHSKNLLSQVPTFGITTNGYLLSEAMRDILLKYGVSVTISIDGPRDIHDLKRPTKGGKGSYEHVIGNVRRLVQEGLDVSFECTYTADHVRAGIHITSLMDFFYQEFQCSVLHCPIVAVSPDNPDFIPLDVCLQMQGDAIEYSLRNLSRNIPKTISTAGRMLHAMVTKRPIIHYCPAGHTQLTVNVDGKIYACFMLMRDSACSFGNVNQASPAPKTVSSTRVGRSEIEGLVADANKYQTKGCRECWALPLCHGCLGEDMERFEGTFLRSHVSSQSSLCDFKRAMVDRFLRSVVQTLSDKITEPIVV